MERKEKTERWTRRRNHLRGVVEGGRKEKAIRDLSGENLLDQNSAVHYWTDGDDKNNPIGTDTEGRFRSSLSLGAPPDSLLTT